MKQGVKVIDLGLDEEKNGQKVKKLELREEVYREYFEGENIYIQNILYI